MDKMDKDILAISSNNITEVISSALQNGGFKAFNSSDEYKELLQTSLMKRRGDLETDESYKQIIPYLVIINGDKVFYYVRAQGGSEARLRNKFSIGVGGHIEIEDIEHADQAIDIALKREFGEEMGEDVKVVNIRPVGFIYTDTAEVDRVHLGILFVGNFSEYELNISDEEIGQYGLATKPEMDVMMNSSEFTAENWTKIAWNMAGSMILDPQ